MCQHPNISKLIDFFETSNHFFIVLELLQGGDLFDYLERRGHFVPEERAKVLFRQICEGIDYLHSLGIVHRDLKIENIMMTSNEEDAVPKIIDFGLAVVLGEK